MHSKDSQLGSLIGAFYKAANEVGCLAPSEALLAEFERYGKANEAGAGAGVKSLAVQRAKVRRQGTHYCCTA